MEKQLYVPFIEGLEEMDLPALELAMETGGAKAAVCENNWPEVAPYAPLCQVSVARTETRLAVLYHVRGLDLRATTVEDGGNSWEDSCCECFLADPSDGTYYNFEITCIGSLLASKRRSRSDATPFGPDGLRRVIRRTSLAPAKMEYAGQVFSWSVAMLIPMEMVGIDPENLPARIRGNFYKCGDKTAHPHFLSWNPVRTETPDFHRPEFFGELILRQDA